MNPYSPPTADSKAGGEGDRPGFWPVAAIRTFSLFHGGLVLVLVLLSSTLLRQGFKEVALLNQQASLRKLAPPQSFASSRRARAALVLSAGALTVAAAAVGVVMVTGLWRLRRWSRWLVPLQ